jgi:hypothetical protein
MSSFSASDAAISGFKFIRQRPKVVLTWAAVFFACELSVVLANLAGNKVAAVQAFQEVNRNDPAAALGMLPSVASIFLFTFAVMILGASLTFTAAYRAFLRPEDDRYAYFRLGGDELRMAAVIGLWVILTLGYSFAVVFVAGLLGAIGSLLPGLLRSLYILLVAAAAICAFVYPIVRLSLSMPMTLEDRHIRLLESWKPTRGRFWPLFGAFVLAAIMIFVVLVVEWTLVSIVVLILVVGLGLTPSALSGLWNPDSTSFTAFFRVTSIIASLLWALFLAVGLAIFVAPVVEAYRWLTDDRDAAA